LGTRVALLRGLAVPFYRFDFVLSDALAVGVHKAEDKLGRSVTCLRLGPHLGAWFRGGGDTGGEGNRAKKQDEAFHGGRIGRVVGDCQAFLARLPVPAQTELCLAIRIFLARGPERLLRGGRSLGLKNRARIRGGGRRTRCRSSWRRLVLPAAVLLENPALVR